LIQANFFNILVSKKATQWMLLAITWVAFLLRTINLATQSLWRDEVDAIRFSSWTISDLVAGLTQKGHNGPLFFMLLRPWRNMTGDTEFALRYPSALIGTLVIPLGYVLARQLGFSRRVGLLLGLLLTTSPYLVWYGQEAKMYALLLATVTLAFTVYLKALMGTEMRWWIVFIVSTSISFYLHILAPLMLIVYAIVALLYYANLRRRWRAWLFSMACLIVPYIPLVLWQFSFLITGTGRGHPFYPLRRQFHLILQLYTGGLFHFSSNLTTILGRLQSYSSNLDRFTGLVEFSSWLHPLYNDSLLSAAGLTPIILFVFLLLCGLFLTARHVGVEKLTLSNRLLLAAWAFLPPLIVYLISLRVPIFEDRYLIYITPAFYLIAVLGLILVRQYSALLANFCLGLILVINLMGIWQQQHHPVKADFRAAAKYLSSQSLPPPSIMVQMPYLQHTFNYYYPHSYTLLEGIWTNSGKTEDTLDTEMTGLTHDLTSLWLVVSEEDTWDNRHLVRAWLDEHAELVDQAHFMQVDVYHYQLRPGTIETQRLDTVVK
jgi:uncharacterized membrane protein